MNNLALNLFGVTLLLVLAGSSASAQIYHPMNWVNDPYCFNRNYALTGADSASPNFINDGVQRGSLFANSPIGATLKLTNPGDAIAFTGQVTLAGDVNADGHLQFRLGLYYQGDIKGDTNWLGYMVGNITGNEGNAAHSLFVRNNPNSGNYGAGLLGNAEMPKCENVLYTPNWSAGTYDFGLTVTQLPGNNHKIAWELTGKPPLNYRQSGAFTNTQANTAPPAFDEVGFLGGAAMFRSASTNNSITFKNVTVTLSRDGETH